MTDVNPRDAKLIQYLNEAYGKEKELERALEGHIQMTPARPTASASRTTCARRSRTPRRLAAHQAAGRQGRGGRPGRAWSPGGRVAGASSSRPPPSPRAAARRARHRRAGEDAQERQDRGLQRAGGDRQLHRDRGARQHRRRQGDGALARDIRRAGGADARLPRAADPAADARRSRRRRSRRSSATALASRRRAVLARPLLAPPGRKLRALGLSLGRRSAVSTVGVSRLRPRGLARAPLRLAASGRRPAALEPGPRRARAAARRARAAR